MLQKINLHLSVTSNITHIHTHTHTHSQKVSNAFAPPYNKYSLGIKAN